MKSEYHTVVDLLRHRAVENHGQKLYSFLNRHGECLDCLTFDELYNKAIGVAVRLQSEMTVGRPVLLYYPHGSDFIVAFFGAILAGAWPVPVSRGRARQWTMFLAILESCSAKFVMTTEARRHSVVASLPLNTDVQVLGVDQSTMSVADYPAESWRPPESSAEDIVFIQYTSGSTAQPKGVVITHRNVLHNSETIHDAFKVSSHDIGLCWLPFHHDMGLIGHIVQPLFAGIHNYFMNPIDFLADPGRWLRAISKYGATISGGPDFAYAHCVNCRIQSGDEFDLSRWRIAYSGSERILPQTLHRFYDAFRTAGFDSRAFFPCYGMAEATLFVSGRFGLQLHEFDTSGTCTTGRYQNVSLGRVDDAQKRTDVRIASLDTDDMVPDGQVGEICIRSPAVSPGYYPRHTGSSPPFNRTLGVESGYFRTGDAGRIHAGLLYFEGRLKNMIKMRGRSVFSEDIEAHVEQRLRGKGIGRCAAISVQQETAETFVILLETDDDIEKAATSKLKHEVNIAVLDGSGVVADVVRFLPRNTLPLTSSGKLRRTACRELYLAAVSDRSAPTDGGMA